MDVRILGTRGEIKASARGHRNHSGVLVDGTLLFDVGEKKFLKSRPRAVFITHLHPDHAAFIREPFTIPPRTPVYAPERSVYPFIKKVTPMMLGSYRITPIPTDHSKKVKSCAYLIERGRKRLLYTGDLLWMRLQYRSKLGMLDCVITEGSFLKEGGMIRANSAGEKWGHAGIPNLIRLFKPHAHTIVLTHFGSWFFKDITRSHAEIALLGKQNGITLVAAHDGMELTV